MYRIRGGDGKEYGPISGEVLRQWIEQGRANADSLVLAEGAANWQALGTVPEFADLTGGTVAVTGYGETAGGDTSAHDQAYALANPAGWALMIVGILGILTCLCLMVFYAVKGVPANPFQNLFSGQGSSDAQRVGQKVGLFAGLIVGIPWAGLIAFAGLKLRRLESWGLVLTGAILAVIPCCGSQFPTCFLSFPVGVWVIIVICQTKVKSAFT